MHTGVPAALLRGFDPVGPSCNYDLHVEPLCCSSKSSGVRGRQTKAAIDAALQAGVKHIVLMSAASTKEAQEPYLGASYWTAEQHLIKKSPRWTFLRMNYYAESMAQEIQMSLGMGVLTGLGAERVGYVSRNDVAAAAAGILLGEGHVGAIYNATGPAAVSAQNAQRL